MTHNGWESGTIILPTAEVAPLKKVVRDYSAKFHNDVRTEVARLHATIGKNTRSTKKYEEALYSQRGTITHFSRSTDYMTSVTNTALEVIASMLHQAQRHEPTPIHKPTVADVSSIAPAVTNKTTSFRVIGTDGTNDAAITFHGRNVTWETDDGNHSVDRARDSGLAPVFFGALKKVQFTRGTGGSIVGNDEYNEDNDNVGGGGNYLVEEFGPLGEAARAQQMNITVAKLRQMKKTQAATNRRRTYTRGW